jgi:hypothetical protein
MLAATNGHDLIAAFARLNRSGFDFPTRAVFA